VRASPVQPTPPAAETRWPRKLLAAEGTLGSLEVELLHRRMDRTSRTSRRCYSSDARGPFIPYGDSHKPRCPFRPSRHLAPAAGPAPSLAATRNSGTWPGEGRAGGPHPARSRLEEPVTPVTAWLVRPCACAGQFYARLPLALDECSHVTWTVMLLHPSLLGDHCSIGWPSQARPARYAASEPPLAALLWPRGPSLEGLATPGT